MHSHNAPLEAGRYYASNTALGLVWMSCPYNASTNVLESHRRRVLSMITSTMLHLQVHDSWKMTAGQT